MSRNENFTEGSGKPLPKTRVFGSGQHELGTHWTWTHPDGKVAVLKDVGGVAERTEYHGDEGTQIVKDIAKMYREHSKKKRG